jgi:outer membrane protein OmpA-like peptidoglycan-associated protein
MRGTLLTGAALLALAAAAPATVHAQQRGSDDPAADAVSGRAEPGRYLVFFALDRATLRPDARAAVAEAAQEYLRGAGGARLALAGHADRSASEEYNRRLSERRVEAVRAELVRLGVPADAIDTVAQGEEDPLVPTADGVREPRNRRVEIEVPQPPPPPPAPAPAVVAEPPPPPPEPAPAVEEERPSRFTFTLGPVYGHNFQEQDEGETENDLVGGELAFNALPGFLGGLSLKQGVFWAFNAQDDGLAGRSVLSLDLAPDLGFVRPRLSLNFGGVYGDGVQDGLVAGPELALDVNLPGGLTLRPKVAYDYQFRNPWDGWDDWGEGILWGGLDLGVRF